jgi:hypothetical protein
MTPIPNTVVSEFLAWSMCLGIFMALQESLCRRFPGIRTLCRDLYLSTAAIAIASGLWALAANARAYSPQQLLAIVNHAFGVGVFVQTSLRALFLVRWLSQTAPAYDASCGYLSERRAVASLAAINDVMRLR